MMNDDWEAGAPHTSRIVFLRTLILAALCALGVGCGAAVYEPAAKFREQLDAIPLDRSIEGVRRILTTDRRDLLLADTGSSVDASRRSIDGFDTSGRPVRVPFDSVDCVIVRQLDDERTSTHRAIMTGFGILGVFVAVVLVRIWTFR
jgi:hypothetical protein